MPDCPSCGEGNPDRARFCLACGAELSSVAPSQTRKTVTVLFTDIAGSTALGDRLDPEALQRMLARYFDCVRGVVERHGATVEKFIGDAVVAVFGVPHVHEDDALRAVRAAVEIRDTLRVLNKELERDFGVSIQTRTGINTGEILAGGRRSEHSLMNADCVNVAARLEQAAGPGETLIGSGTHTLVRDAIVAESVGPLTLKGKPGTVEAWRLLEVAPHTAGVTRRLDAPLVGRTRELALLRQAFERSVEERRCHLFTVLGPAGVGKSRLIKEFIDGIPADTVALHGRCLSYGEGITFRPLAKIVRAAAGINLADTADAAIQKIADVLGRDGTEKPSRHLAAMIGLAPPTRAPEEEFWAARTFLQRFAGDAPLVVVVDDIHWGEPAFLDFLEHVADWTRGTSMLLVCVARPELLEHRARWGGGKVNATSILLEPLSESDADRLIQNRVGRDALPSHARRKILQVAGGNPLFVEETIAMLIDRGTLRIGSDGTSLAAELDEIAMPPTIDALLTARLDGLDATERAVLEGASVVGEQFGIDEVQALSPEGASGARFIDTLMRKELLRPDAAGMRFSHALVRDATYNAIPKARRAGLHERFADWLETTVGERLTEYQELLGHHLSEAIRFGSEVGNPARGDLARRASEHLAQAGRRAFARGDASAAALLRRALEIDAEGLDRPATLLALGGALFEVGDLQEAERALEESERAAGGNSLAKAKARLALLDIRLVIDPRSRTVESVRREIDGLISIFAAAGDHESLCKSWLQVGQASNLVGRQSERLDALERAADHARHAGGLLYQVSVLPELMKTVALTAGGGAAMHYYDEFLTEDAPVPVRVQALKGRAYHELASGSIDHARRLFAEASALCEEFGLGLALQSVRMWRGYAELEAGDTIEAERVLRLVYDYLTTRGEGSYRSTAGACLAMAFNQQGRHAEALQLARECLALGSDEDFATQVSGRSAEAVALAALGSPDEAEPLAREAVEIAKGADQYSWNAEALKALGLVLQLSGKTGEARETFEAAAALYESKGSVNSAARARELFRGGPAQQPSV